jgi:TetR/AcrR family transcriptional regulator, fatty acid metabolism regulator protein
MGAALRIGAAQLTAVILNDIHYGEQFILERTLDLDNDSGLPLLARIRSQKMPLISPERMQDRYDTILDAAERAFTEKGFEGASIADIARIADISDGLVYRYFPSKRDLLYGVLKKFYERILVDLENEVFKHKRFRARLEVLIKRHIQVFVSDTDLCRLFIAEVRVASDYEGSAIQELNRRYTSVLIRIIREAVKTGEVRGDVNPKLLRDVIFGAIEHLAWGHVNGRGQLRAAQTARELTGMLTSGICLDE